MLLKPGGFSALGRWLGLPLFFPFVLGAQSFTAQLERPAIRLGEVVILTLRVENGRPTAGPTLPTIPNISIRGGGTALHESIINGRRSSALVYSYQLSPAATGDFSIPPISIEVDGKKFQSQPLTLKVLERIAVPPQPGPGSIQPGTASPNPNPRAPAVSPRLFARIVLPKTEFYLGEVFLADVQVHMIDAQIAQMPLLKADGFTIGRGGQGGTFAVQTNNGIYYVYTFRYPVAAAKTGTLRLGPAEIPINLPSLDFFSGQRFYRTNVYSPMETVTIKPLPPENVPEYFSGAVGSYALVGTASPTNIAVGDPVNVRIQIAGRGTLDSLLLPPQKHWGDFKTYPPVVKVESNDPFQIEGLKLFDLTIVPQKVDLKGVPPFYFSYFDPEVRQYKTLTWAGAPLVVRPSASVGAPNLASTTDKPRAERPELLHIKAHLGGISSPGLLLHQPWFLLIQGAPILIWMAALGWRKQKEFAERNPELRRQRQLREQIHDGIRQLKNQAEANKAELFFPQLMHLLQWELGARLRLPAASLTESALEQPAAKELLKPEERQQLEELFQACIHYKYSGSASTARMKELADTLEQCVARLERTTRSAS